MNARFPRGKFGGSAARIFVSLLAGVVALVIIGMIVLANRGELHHYVGGLAGIPYGDKLGHFVLMGSLSLLVNLSFLAKRISIGGRQVLVGSMLVAILVTAEELSQGLFVNRTMDVYDWIADMIGIVLAGQLALRIVGRSK